MHNRPYDVPPLNLLEGFEAAARTLSFTRAAAELFLTQSAVSRQIKTLEAWMGVALFERHTRALSLTPAGVALQRTVSEVLQQVHDTAKRIRQPVHARTFTVTTTPTFASLWLIPRLGAYTQAHAKVDVRISASNDVVDLDRAGIELAIRYGGPSIGSHGRRLFDEEVLPVCAPVLMHDAKRPLTRPEDLRHHTLLHFDDARNGTPALNWATWLQAFGLSNLESAGALHFSHYDQLVLAAINGQGVALGRTPLLRRTIREGRLCVPFGTRTVAARAYYVVLGRAATANEDVAPFVDWLVAEAKSEGSDARKGAR